MCAWWCVKNDKSACVRVFCVLLLFTGRFIDCTFGILIIKVLLYCSEAIRFVIVKCKTFHCFIIN